MDQTLYWCGLDPKEVESSSNQSELHGLMSYGLEASDSGVDPTLLGPVLARCEA